MRVVLPLANALFAEPSWVTSPNTYGGVFLLCPISSAGTWPLVVAPLVSLGLPVPCGAGLVSVGRRNIPPHFCGDTQLR